MKYIVLGLLAAASVVPAMAETPAAVPAQVTPQVTAPITPPAQPVAVLAPVAQESVLRAGSEIPLVTREELTTEKKKLRVGQRFQLEVASNVMANGVVVIPAGTPAVGEVTEVRNKGMWGKSGYINARVISLRHGDRVVRLSGTFDDKGVTGTAGVVGAVALVPIAGFFMTGTSAKIPSSSPVKAFLDEDIAFKVVPAAAPILEVPATPAAPAPVAAVTMSTAATAASK